MPPDPGKSANGSTSRKAAPTLLSQGDRLLDTVGFHAQQCAEKALKAFLAHHQRAFAKTHELEYLVNLCASIDPSFAGFLPTAAELTVFAVVNRYPGAVHARRDQVSGHVSTAERILRRVDELTRSAP